MMAPGFGARLKSRRKELGWTLDELAARAGLSKTFVWQLEAGKSVPSADSLVTLADATGLSLDFLARGEERKPLPFDRKKAMRTLAKLNGLLNGGPNP